MHMRRKALPIAFADVRDDFLVLKLCSCHGNVKYAGRKGTTDDRDSHSTFCESPLCTTADTKPPGRVILSIVRALAYGIAEASETIIFSTALDLSQQVFK